MEGRGGGHPMYHFRLMTSKNPIKYENREPPHTPHNPSKEFDK
jgi:hypothetical protein